MNYLVDVALQDSTVQNAAERQYFAEFEGHWQLTLYPNISSHEEGRLPRRRLAGLKSRDLLFWYRNRRAQS